MRKISKIIIHCSASAFGTAALIDSWHKERGFNEIGYHYVIRNFKPALHHDPVTLFNGMLEVGRAIEKVGAHCSGENETSIGICLIGYDEFTDRQFETLDKLVMQLMHKFSVPLEHVIGHYETPSGKMQGKTCPNFNMAAYRNRLREKLYV